MNARDGYDVAGWDAANEYAQALGRLQAVALVAARQLAEVAAARPISREQLELIAAELRRMANESVNGEQNGAAR